MAAQALLSMQPSFSLLSGCHRTYSLLIPQKLLPPMNHSCHLTGPEPGRLPGLHLGVSPHLCSSLLLSGRRWCPLPSKAIEESSRETLGQRSRQAQGHREGTGKYPGLAKWEVLASHRPKVATGGAGTALSEMWAVGGASQGAAAATGVASGHWDA